jgi:alkylation response protein AidB-like acyl-CoA dehydrogenase
MNFGSDELKRKVMPEVFSAKKFICLAISEGIDALQKTREISECLVKHLPEAMSQV